MVGRICWFSSKSDVIYATLEMLLRVCMRDGAVWFALMPLREEQPAFNGFRCCFSSLINTVCSCPPLLFSLFLSSPLTSTSADISMQIRFTYPLCHCLSAVRYFLNSVRSGSGQAVCGQAGNFYRPFAAHGKTTDHSSKQEVRQTHTCPTINAATCSGYSGCGYTGAGTKA